MLAPERVRVPALAIFSATVPVPFEIPPERTIGFVAPLGLIVKVFVPEMPEVMLPVSVAPVPPSVPI